MSVQVIAELGNGMDIDWGERGIAVALGAKGVKILTNEGRTIGELPGPAFSVRWSPDSRRLAVGSEGKVIIYDSETLTVKEEHSLPGPVLALSWRKYGLAAGGDGWLAFQHGGIWKVIEVGMRVWVLDWGLDQLAVGTWDGILLIIEDGKIKIEKKVNGSISSLAWGKYLVIGTINPGAIYKVERAVEGDITLTKMVEIGGASSVAWEPGNELIAVGDQQYHYVIFLSDEGMMKYKRKITSMPLSISWSPEGTALVVLADDGKVIYIRNPKIEEAVQVVLDAADCPRISRLLCKALESALFKLISRLSPNVSPHVIADNLIKYKEKVFHITNCLLKNIELLKDVLDNYNFHKAVEIASQDCSKLPQWVKEEREISKCVIELKPMIEKSETLLSSQLVPFKLPPPEELVRKLGCEEARKLVSCMIDVLATYPEVVDKVDDMNLAMPPLYEIVNLLTDLKTCEKVREILFSIEDKVYEAEEAADQGDIEKVFEISEEVKSLLRQLQRVKSGDTSST